MNAWPPNGSVRSSGIYTPPMAPTKYTMFLGNTVVAEEELWYALPFEPITEENHASNRKICKRRKN